MIEYFSYILFFTTLLIVVVYIYIKIKYGFWVYQPVFHVYDFWYMIYPPGIIMHQLPNRNKYTNFKNIETFLYKELPDFKLQRFIHFINANYLQNKDNIFKPDIKNIVPYFIGHNENSFISFYKENELITDLKKGTTLSDERIIGAITSRPIHIFINIGENESFFDAYYVDYICVD